MKSSGYDVFVKHFIDSILSTDKLIGENLLDVGSGGGFPAIPIKIIRDDISVTMLEATNKKCEFLRLVIKELGLKNINVICGRAEDLAKNAELMAVHNSRWKNVNNPNDNLHILTFDVCYHF